MNCNCETPADRQPIGPRQLIVAYSSMSVKYPSLWYWTQTCSRFIHPWVNVACSKKCIECSDKSQSIYQMKWKHVNILQKQNKKTINKKNNKYGNLVGWWKETKLMHCLFAITTHKEVLPSWTPVLLPSQPLLWIFSWTLRCVQTSHIHSSLPICLF